MLEIIINLLEEIFFVCCLNFEEFVWDMCLVVDIYWY